MRRRRFLSSSPANLAIESLEQRALLSATTSVMRGESIQDAIDAAPEGGTVRVQAGVYDEHIVIKDKSLKLIAFGIYEDMSTDMATEFEHFPGDIDDILGNGVSFPDFAEERFVVLSGRSQLVPCDGGGVPDCFESGYAYADFLDAPEVGDGIYVENVDSLTVSGFLVTLAADAGINVTNVEDVKLNNVMTIGAGYGDDSGAIPEGHGQGIRINNVTKARARSVFSLINYTASGIQIDETRSFIGDEIVSAYGESDALAARHSEITINSGGFGFTNSNGISVTGSKKLNLTEVQSFANAGSGLVVGAANSVNLVESSFSENGEDGIQLGFVSTAKLTSVVAENNDEDGLELESARKLYVFDSDFSDNGDGATSGDPGPAQEHHGLEIRNVTELVHIRNTEASGNDETGLSLQTEGESLEPRVAIVDSTFDNNLAAGIQLDEVGDVVLNRVSANQNTGDGFYASDVRDVSIMSSSFGQNLNGIYVDDVGDVTLKHVTTEDNTESGSLLDDPAKVFIKSLESNQNGGSGMQIEYPQDVTVKALTAMDNAGAGLLIESGRDVDLSDSEFSANEAGLVLIDTDDVLLDRVRTDSNSDRGINIEEADAAVIRDSETNENGDDGIFVCDVVSLKVVRANSTENVEDGIYIEDVRKTVVNRSTFEMNGIDGIAVEDSGRVVIANSISAMNANDGVYASNVERVFLNASQFSDNGDDGADINDVLKFTRLGFDAFGNADFDLEWD
ncbi:MAG: right-handed parallel beta-helix repeat-containing protein [Planctomycetaceae bacterium]